MLFKTLFLSIVTFSAAAQTVTLRGKVTDSKTGAPLPFVNVYVNRTTFGMQTTTDGSFEITGLLAGNHELICSLVGYETVKSPLALKTNEVKTITVLMKAADIELSEVTVNAKRDKQWTKDLKRFKKAFLGRDGIAEECDIANPEVLEFTDLKGNGLGASATAPLIIINKALGYQVRYELVAFEQYPKHYRIAGNVHFKSLDTYDSVMLQRWDGNREATYGRSTISFYRAFITDQFAEIGYEVYKEKVYERELTRTDVFSYVKPYLTKLDPMSHVFKTDTGIYVLEVDTRIEIHDKRSNRGTTYRDVKHPISWLELSRPLIVSEYGVPQNPEVVQVLGAMSDLRVAHLLPEDYVPSASNYNVLANPKKASLAEASESIFIHTDRDYYFPGDYVWLKGYMQYGRPDLMDSLSGAVYIELIDSTKSVVSRVTFPIRNSTFDGRMIIPATRLDRYYAIRAYTNWMRNFSEEYFFYKPLAVVNPFERVVSAFHPKQTDNEYQVIIDSLKNAYKTGDSIEIMLACVDADSVRVPCQLSVSVTDLEFSASLQTAQKRIVERRISEFQYRYPIERGVSATGSITNGNRKSTEPVTVTAVLGKFEDVKTFKTDAKGRFFVTGYQFYDSSHISFQAKDKKGRVIGKFVLDQPQIAPVTQLPKLPAFQIAPSRSAAVRYSDLEGDAVQLEEVTITAKKEKFKEMRLSGDHAVSGDHIRSVASSSLMNFLSRRGLPRVRTKNYVDAMGIYRTVVEIVGMQGIPLLVIDGVAFDSQQDIASLINQININDVERMEVLISSSSIFGTRGAGGVLVITTKAFDGVYDKDQANEFSTADFDSFPMYGFSSFNAFDQTKLSGEVPDVVATIFWAPNIVNDGVDKSRLTFRASSLSSRYLVSIEGVTADGHLISGETIINIE